MLIRFINGYVFTKHQGISDQDLDKIRKDFKAGEVANDDAREQLSSWLSDLGAETVEFDGEDWIILRFGSEKIRAAVTEGRASQAMPSDDEESWHLAASTVIRCHSGHGWAEEYSITCRRRQVEEYRSLTHEEWVSAKNALQRLIAAGEGWRLDPSKPELKGYEAMFGLMARAAWNAARCCNGMQLCVPSAESISAECEKLIRRWELRRMI